MKDEPKVQRTMEEILAEIRKTFAEDGRYIEPKLGSLKEAPMMVPHCQERFLHAANSELRSLGQMLSPTAVPYPPRGETNC